MIGKVLLTVLLMTLTISLKAQQLLEQYYKGCYEVLEDSAKLPIDINSSWVRYNPSMDDLRRGEKVLCENYGEHYRKEYEKIKSQYQLTDIEHAQWQKLIDKADYIKEFKAYSRQYLGFMTDKGEKIILINLINFRNKEIKNSHPDWRTNYVVGLGKVYEQNTRSFYVNIDENEINR